MLACYSTVYGQLEEMEPWNWSGGILITSKRKSRGEEAEGSTLMAF